jgi:urease accessory protein
MRASLLLLADSRLPAGGHAHSGGLEAAVAAGRVTDIEGLDGFLRGRLATTGLVAASFAAAACARCVPVPGPMIGTTSGKLCLQGQPETTTPGKLCRSSNELGVLDTEYDARTPSPALRRVSRQQGKALLRAGRAMWPIPLTAPTAPTAPADPHHPIAVGIVAAAAGLGPVDAALVTAYGAVTGPASAAVRLLGLDPYEVQALLAALAPACDETAAKAASHAEADPADLPAAGAPLLDIGAEVHASWEVRLFAS